MTFCLNIILSFKKFKINDNSAKCTFFLVLVLTTVTCSIGGADYGSVRIGAFMGRKMIKSIASALLSRSLAGSSSQQLVDAINSEEFEEHGINLLEEEASLDYLCNLSPHR